MVNVAYYPWTNGVIIKKKKKNYITYMCDEFDLKILIFGYRL